MDASEVEAEAVRVEAAISMESEAHAQGHGGVGGGRLTWRHMVWVQHGDRRSPHLARPGSRLSTTAQTLWPLPRHHGATAAVTRLPETRPRGRLPWSTASRSAWKPPFLLGASHFLAELCGNYPITLCDWLSSVKKPDMIDHMLARPHDQRGKISKATTTPR